MVRDPVDRAISHLSHWISNDRLYFDGKCIRDNRQPLRSFRDDFVDFQSKWGIGFFTGIGSSRRGMCDEKGNFYLPEGLGEVNCFNLLDKLHFLETSGLSLDQEISNKDNTALIVTLPNSVLLARAFLRSKGMNSLDEFNELPRINQGSDFFKKTFCHKLLDPNFTPGTMDFGSSSPFTSSMNNPAAQQLLAGILLDAVSKEGLDMRLWNKINNQMTSSRSEFIKYDFISSIKLL